MTPSDTRRHTLAHLLDSRRLRVLGINSGTSIDGLDLALLDITDDPDGPSFCVLETKSTRFPKLLHNALVAAASNDQLEKSFISRLDIAFGRFIGRTVTLFQMATNRGSAHGVDLIGSHGQTIGHFPDPATGSPSGRATWQIGSASAIAQESHCPVVADFRIADIVAGGLGAPLSGYYHHLMFGSDVPVLNLGGIANVSVSYKVRGVLNICAFDVGPGNLLMDAISTKLLEQPFDRHGRAARRGQPLPGVVKRVLAHSYFRKHPPKTCGREEFNWDVIERYFFQGRKPLADADTLLATAVEITATSIADAARRWIEPLTNSRELVITGGGAFNRTLMERLAELMPEWTMQSPEQWNIPTRYVEPAGFALLAHETLRGRPGNVGGATGGKPAVLGVIAIPTV